MRNLSSLTATAAILMATSIGSADARPVHSSVLSTTCATAVMGSEAQEPRNCTGVRTVRKSARAIHRSESHRSHAARHSGSCGGSLSLIRAVSGATACVAHRAASSFQAFVTALEATGYRIDFMGGWRAHGSCRQCNMHPRGLAIDINQTGRNRVTHRFPVGVTQLAAQYGLLHGAVWHDADAGHFELMSESPTAQAYASSVSTEHVARRASRHRVAALTTSHAAVTTNGSAQGSGH